MTENPSPPRRRAPLSFWLLLWPALLLVGCAGSPRWPAISDAPTHAHDPGRWVWVELLTADVAAARQFYGTVFGWQFQSLSDVNPRYTLIESDGIRIGGMLDSPKRRTDGRSARWVGLLSVADVARAVAAAQAAGGSLVAGPLQLAGRGEAALLADPEGARFGVMHATGGDPVERLPATGQWLWHELWAHDGSAMADFYAAVGGYSSAPRDMTGPAREWLLESDGSARAGIVQAPRAERLRSSWLQYVRVASLDAALQRVREAGGRVLLAPDPAIRQGRVALVADPQGAALGLAEWPDESRGAGR